MTGTTDDHLVLDMLDPSAAAGGSASPVAVGAPAAALSPSPLDGVAASSSPSNKMMGSIAPPLSSAKTGAKPGAVELEDIAIGYTNSADTDATDHTALSTGNSDRERMLGNYDHDGDQSFTEGSSRNGGRRSSNHHEVQYHLFAIGQILQSRLTDVENEAKRILPAYLHEYLNKGDVSTFCTFCVMVLGLLSGSDLLIAFGLFGFAGGITNWLAIKMLFEEVLSLPGSGVIPKRFREIRTVVKTTIMKAFFDDEFLSSYLSSRAPKLIESLDLAAVLEKPEFEQKLKNKLEEISMTPEGAMLLMIKQMFGGSFDALMPMLRPTLTALAKDLTTGFDITQFVSVDRIKTEIDLLMTEKLQLLTPELVKTLLENMIRKHLGWLVLWGNVFGGLIGIFSHLAKLAFG